MTTTQPQYNDPRVALKKDKGLLALLFATHTDPVLQARFMHEDTFDEVMKEYDIDPATRDLILEVGIAGGSKMGGSKADLKKAKQLALAAGPDKKTYMALLERLYDLELGKRPHFRFSW